MVRLISVMKLAEDLRDGRVSERDKLQYLFVWAVLSTVFSLLTAAKAQVLDQNTVVATGGMLVVACFGLWACFEANQRGDGHSFVERVVLLGIPLAIRMFVLLNASWYTIVWAVSAAGMTDAWREEQRSMTMLAIQVAVYIAVMVWLRNAVAVAAQGLRKDMSGSAAEEVVAT